MLFRILRVTWPYVVFVGAMLFGAGYLQTGTVQGAGIYVGVYVVFFVVCYAVAYAVEYFDRRLWASSDTREEGWEYVRSPLGHALLAWLCPIMFWPLAAFMILGAFWSSAEEVGEGVPSRITFLVLGALMAALAYFSTRWAYRVYFVITRWNDEYLELRYRLGGMTRYRFQRLRKAGYNSWLDYVWIRPENGPKIFVSMHERGARALRSHLWRMLGDRYNGKG